MRCCFHEPLYASRIPAGDWMNDTRLLCPEIGMKIQERMYESNELTTEWTACEIKKELALEWECCG